MGAILQRLAAITTLPLVLLSTGVRGQDQVSGSPSLVTAFVRSLGTPAIDLERVYVPTVGCEQDGQVGPQPAPRLPKTARVIIPRGMSSFLALYSAHGRLEGGVLAPRNWRCFGTYGSSGSTLYVTPLSLRGPVLDRPSKIKDGPVIIDTFADGDTSGRFSVAKIAARLFPIARSFVEQVRKEGLDDAGQYVFAPWSTDKLVRLSDFVASYVTRSGTAGLGTVVMEPSPDLPVSGIVLLRRAVGSDAFNLEHLAIRLPLSEQQLSNAILIEALTKAQKEAAHDEAAGGANARPKSACEGILRHNQNGFWIDVPPEGACEINKDEENKVLAACNVGHYCKIEGELQDCEDSGECSEIHKITHVSRRKH